MLFFKICHSTQLQNFKSFTPDVSYINSYRKIPGDKCEGGKMPERKEIDLSKRCVSDLVGPELLVSTSAY